MGFLKSLRQGKVGEDLICDILDSQSIKYELNNDIWWDIECEIDNQKIKLEIKRDIMEAKTGNIAIEYYNTKKCTDSGINATLSNIWIIILKDNSIWATQTKKLKTFFNKESCIKDVNGGDDNAQMRIYNKEHILSIFTRLDKLSNYEIITTLKKLVAQK